MALRDRQDLVFLAATPMDARAILCFSCKWGRIFGGFHYEDYYCTGFFFLKGLRGQQAAEAMRQAIGKVFQKPNMSSPSTFAQQTDLYKPAPIDFAISAGVVPFSNSLTAPPFNSTLIITILLFNM